ncbi:MAG: YceD family protein [Caulobacterales bacterium]
MTIAAPFWRQIVPMAELVGGPHRFRLAPDAAQRAAAARLLGVEAIPFLQAELSTRPWLDGVEVDGEIRARLTQICSVSADAFDAEVTAPVALRIVPIGSPNAPPQVQGEHEIDLEADDPPDEADEIDLAGYVLELLAISLDPYPRKTGVTFEPPARDPTDSPFAALAALKQPKP